jgi:hypothetical protein
MQAWRNFDHGSTIGTQGSESGSIVLDEEHPEGARITLEQSARVAPFAITCGIYGWFFHTRYFSIEPEAKNAFSEMKAALDRIIEQINQITAGLCDPDTAEEARQRSISAIGEFVEKFPT